MNHHTFHTHSPINSHHNNMQVHIAFGQQRQSYHRTAPQVSQNEQSPAGLPPSTPIQRPAQLLLNSPLHTLTPIHHNHHPAATPKHRYSFYKPQSQRSNSERKPEGTGGQRSSKGRTYSATGGENTLTSIRRLLEKQRKDRKSLNLSCAELQGGQLYRISTFSSQPTLQQYEETVLSPLSTVKLDCKAKNVHQVYNILRAKKRQRTTIRQKKLVPSRNNDPARGCALTGSRHIEKRKELRIDAQAFQLQKLSTVCLGRKTKRQWKTQSQAIVTQKRIPLEGVVDGRGKPDIFRTLTPWHD